MVESPFKPEILRGKVALLTGGGSGIGYEISLQLGKHGASIAIMGRRKHVVDSAVSSLHSLGISQLFSRLLRGLGNRVVCLVGKEDPSMPPRNPKALKRDRNCLELDVSNIRYRAAIGFEGDVRKREDANRVVESTVKHFGGLDILVNAAAGNFLVPSEDLSPNGFRTVMDIDSVGTFTMCHEALKYLKKGGPGKDPSTAGGVIINISATLHYTASWYQIHVSAAKAAVDSITRNLALEWGTDYDIRVNGIAPGPIGDTAGMSKLGLEGIASKAMEKMPLFKVGEKWDIAMAALYLASDAGKYVNGTTLVVDGGEWLSKPRHFPKDEVKQLSRVVEKRSRHAPKGVPDSKL